MLGFAAGVMIAASFWSLLAPAIAMSEGSGVPGWIPAVVGFLLGGAFLWMVDRILPHLHLGLEIEEAEGIKTTWQRSVLLVTAITLHNFPEGLAVVWPSGGGRGIARRDAGGRDRTDGRDRHPELPGRAGCLDAAAPRGLLAWEKLPVRPGVRFGGAYCRRSGRGRGPVDEPSCRSTELRRRRHDLRGRGGVDTRVAAGQVRTCPRSARCWGLRS